MQPEGTDKTQRKRRSNGPRQQPHARWAQVREWQRSGDTGLSSETMLSAALGERPPRSAWNETNYPHDPSDLGRCVRLLERMPWVAGGFAALRRACRVWRAYLDNWDELLELYRIELPTGQGPRLYARMQQLQRRVA